MYYLYAFFQMAVVPVILIAVIALLNVINWIQMQLC